MTFSSLRFRCVALAAAYAGVLALPAWAQDPDFPPPGPPQGRAIMPQAARGDARSLSDTIRHVQRSTGGQILGAERVPFDGRSINRVKYLDDRGRVRYMDDPVPDRMPARAPRPAPEPGNPSPRGDHR